MLGKILPPTLALPTPDRDRKDHVVCALTSEVLVAVEFSLRLLCFGFDIHRRNLWPLRWQWRMHPSVVIRPIWRWPRDRALASMIAAPTIAMAHFMSQQKARRPGALAHQLIFHKDDDATYGIVRAARQQVNSV